MVGAGDSLSNHDGVGVPVAPPQTPSSVPRLGPTLAIVFLASISTGAVNNGVFFIAQEAHGFGRGLNLLLGLVVGAVYIPAALAVGPGLRALAARSARITTRRVLAGMMVVMAGLCAIPVAAGGAWGVWLFVALYVPLMGALWPIVESYLSGGRRGERLRRATGWFNLLWASAVAVAAWGMAPLLQLDRPLGVFVGLGLIHLMCLVPVARLSPEAPRHIDEPHEPHPPAYVGLLATFRWLLVLSYVLLATLNPILPWRLDQTGLEIGWQTPLVSAWMVSRVAMFVLLQRWGGWHGRWRTPIWSSGLMLAGFLLVLFAGGRSGIIAGLLMFGGGIGAIYAAALYYAMEVGGAEVDAGGTHEAMIGAGYTLGPVIGLIAVFLTSDADDRFAPTLATLSLFVTAVCVCLAAVTAVRSVRRAGSATSGIV